MPLREVTDPTILEAFGVQPPVATGHTTVSGRPTYRDSSGGEYSEKTVTFPLGDKWVTFPSVDAKGNIMSEDQVADYVRQNGPVDPITGEEFPTFNTMEEAVDYAKQRSATRLPESGVREVTDPEVLEAFGVDKPTDQPKEVRRGKEAGTYASFVAGLSSDEKETVQWLASQLYPDEPIEKAVTRFGKQDGTLYHIDDDGQAYQALPSGWSLGNAAKTLAEGMPMVAGATAGIVTAPAAMTGPIGLFGSMAAAGGASAATEAGRQALGDTLMGEASTDDMNELAIAKEGATAALGEGIGYGIGALATRHAVKDIAKFDPGKTASAYDDAAKAGVDITPAEATGLPTLAAQQKRLGNITPTADKMRGFYARRNEQVVNAWQKSLDQISQHADAEDVGRLARETADEVLTGARKALQAKAAPLYKLAMEEGDRVIESPELERLTASPTFQNAMRGAVRTWQDAVIADGYGAMNPGAVIERGGQLKFLSGKVPVFPNLQFWDYTKRNLDAILESDKAINPKTGGLNSFGRTVAILKSKLVNELDSLAPDSYKQARAIYGSGADDVSTAMQSALGTLAKTKDTAVLSAARQIFDPKTRSPQMVGKLRSALEKQNPEAWQALKRLYMQDVTVDALKLTETGEVANPAGKLFKAFANPRVQANLRAAMTGDEYQRMQGLLSVFRRASSVPVMRSDTEFNRLMTEEAKRAAKPLSAKIAGNINPAQALRNFEEWRTEKNLDRQANAVVDLVTSGNPKAIETMKELRQLSPTSKRFAMLFGQLLSYSGSWGASEALPEADTGPGDYTAQGAEGGEDR